ncbi:hypothetical protein [Streptomyces sp. NPDC049040]|uniref:hypothetical protein n=1 Tax=Streptomyces sp. NPDC049040 TaxID=3365593 RepID=UPI003724617F
MWWLKARRAPTVLTSALVAFLLLACVVQNTLVPLPSLTGSTQVALSLFVPIPLVAALMLCLESRLTAAEISGVRAVAVLDAALVVVTVAAAVAVGMAVDAAFDAGPAGAAGRNTAFLTGLMLCGRAFVGERAVMIPVAWLLLVVLVGFRSTGDPRPWTVVPEPLGAVHATIGTLLVFCVGMLAHLYTSRKMP